MTVKKETWRNRTPFALFACLLLAASPILQADEAGNGEDQVQILRETGRAFSVVASETIPAVVFITVEKTVEQRAPAHPFGGPRGPGGLFGDEFFERFFGPAPRQRERVVQGQGSGFIVSEDGYILTNNHVVGDADDITVILHDGREFKAERVGTDPRSEVAVIKIVADEGEAFPCVKLGSSADLEIGEWVVAVGNPFGLSASVTVGVVSAKGRRDIGIAEYEDFIQTDAAINPGNSGGPLLNVDGEVIGINTAIFSRTGGYMGIGFAIPIDMVKTIMDQLIETGTVTRGFIGVAIRDVTEELAEAFGLDEARGILIETVEENSPGDQAGLEHGDIILESNGEPVDSSTAFRNTVAGNPPGTEYELVLFRNEEEITVTVMAGRRDEEEEEEEDAPATEEEKELFGKLGMTLEPLTEELAAQLGYEDRTGLVVTEVARGGQAARIGIQPGYLVKSVGRQEVETVRQFTAAVRAHARNGRIMLRVRGPRRAQYVIMNID